MTEPFDLPDDLETLAVLSLDMRLSWNEPDPPIRIAAWRKWHEIRRREREMPRIDQAIAESSRPVLAFSSAPAVLPLPPHGQRELRRRLNLGTRLVVNL